MDLERHLLGFTPSGSQSSRINAPPIHFSQHIYIYIYTVQFQLRLVTGNFIRKLRASWIDQSAIPWVMSLFLYVGYVSVTTGNHHYISSKILIRSDSKGIWTCDFVFKDFQAPFLMYNKNIMFFFPWMCENRGLYIVMWPNIPAQWFRWPQDLKIPMCPTLLPPLLPVPSLKGPRPKPMAIRCLKFSTAPPANWFLGDNGGYLQLYTGLQFQGSKTLHVTWQLHRHGKVVIMAG